MNHQRWPQTYQRWSQTLQQLEKRESPVSTSPLFYPMLLDGTQEVLVVRKCIIKIPVFSFIYLDQFAKWNQK